MENELTTKDYWQQTGVLASQNRGIPASFAKLFKTILKKNEHEEGVALEIGCAPGTFLAYICKEFGYKPEGVDYAKGAAEITKKTLRDSGLTESTIYEEDFFKWKPNKKYDLVSSFGLIEHFHDVSPIVEKHVSLLKSGGILILEVPSFGNGQYFLHNWLDKSNVDRCNIDIMNLAFFKDITKRYNLKTTYLGYIGGVFDFWWENENPTLWQNIIRYFLKPIAFLGRRIPIQNKYFSPFIVFIAEKQS